MQASRPPRYCFSAPTVWPMRGRRSVWPKRVARSPCQRPGGSLKKGPMSLIGCPFCRELFTEGEADACPVCGVPLRPVEKLPLSYEARVALATELAAVPPEDRV